MTGQHRDDVHPVTAVIGAVLVAVLVILVVVFGAVALDYGVGRLVAWWVQS